MPDEDTGTIMISVTTAPGTSLHGTSEILTRLEEEIKVMPQIKAYSVVAGYSLTGSGASTGMIIASLKDWSERQGKNDDLTSVIAAINVSSAKIPDAQVFVAAPPMISRYGTVGGFEVYVQDRTGGSVTDLDRVTKGFIAELQKRPEIGDAYTSFSVDYPQYMVDVDAAKCERAGLAPSEILGVISGYYGGQYVSNFNRFSKFYRVMIQASPEYRVTPESLNHIFVRASGGEMTPVGQFVSITKTYGPEMLNRFNLYGAICINGSPARAIPSVTPSGLSGRLRTSSFRTAMTTSS